MLMVLRQWVLVLTRVLKHRLIYWEVSDTSRCSNKSENELWILVPNTKNNLVYFSKQAEWWYQPRWGTDLAVMDEFWEKRYDRVTFTAS